MRVYGYLLPILLTMFSHAAFSQPLYSSDGRIYVNIDSGSISFTSFEGFAFVGHTDGPLSPCPNGNCGPQSLMLDPTSFSSQVIQSNAFSAGFSNPYATARSSFLREGNSSVLDLFSDSSITTNVFAAGQPATGLSVNRVDASVLTTPGVQGILLTYFYVVDEPAPSAFGFFLPDDSVLTTTGPRSVLVRISKVEGTSSSLTRMRVDQVTVAGGRVSTTNFPPGGPSTLPTDDLTSFAGAADLQLITAAFTDASLDANGDGRFTREDVDFISSSPVFLSDFDLNGSGTIDAWDIQTLYTLADAASAGLVGDANGDGLVDCQDLVIAANHTFGPSVVQGTPGYRIEFDTDLDGNNDADDKADLQALFLSIEPANYAFDAAVNNNDLIAFLALYNAGDPAADIAPAGNPDGVVNLFDYFQFINYYNNPNCF